MCEPGVRIQAPTANRRDLLALLPVKSAAQGERHEPLTNEGDSRRST